MTLDATVNPDFSQIESDAFQVQVNQRFPVFFSEKRPFFMEGAGIFTLAGTGDFRMDTAFLNRVGDTNGWFYRDNLWIEGAGRYQTAQRGLFLKASYLLRF